VVAGLTKIWNWWWC